MMQPNIVVHPLMCLPHIGACGPYCPSNLSQSLYRCNNTVGSSLDNERLGNFLSTSQHRIQDMEPEIPLVRLIFLYMGNLSQNDRIDQNVYNSTLLIIIKLKICFQCKLPSERVPLDSNRFLEARNVLFANFFNNTFKVLLKKLSSKCFKLLVSGNSKEYSSHQNVLNS